MPEPLRALKLTEPPVAPVTDGYDVERIREDFPILRRTVGRWPLVYLDSANTSQKPVQVVDALEEHYLQHNANVARAMHTLGGEATEAFEGARTKVADFIGAAGPAGDRVHQERDRGPQPRGAQPRRSPVRR